MKRSTLHRIGSLCAAALVSTGASAAVIQYTFTGGGGLNPVGPGNPPSSGWLTENATSFPGFAPVTPLDNGVSSLIPGNWLDTMGGGLAPFDATYSGSAIVTDGALTSGTLAWTGELGLEASAAPGSAGVGFYAIALTNGAYNLKTGAYSGGLVCAANPGGLAPTACSDPRNTNPLSFDLPLGTITFVDNGNGTVTLQMGSNDFTNNGGVKDSPAGAGNGSADYNHRVTWTLNATAAPVPVPAAAWLVAPAVLAVARFARRRQG